MTMVATGRGDRVRAGRGGAERDRGERERLERERIEQEQAEHLSRLGLLAAAISGRPLAVAPAADGEATWTDGRTLFIDLAAGRPDQLTGIAVQSSLLAAGSLDGEVVRRLLRRPDRARRYLAIEAHRALVENGPHLPPGLRRLADHDAARLADSTRESLALALGRAPITLVPSAFGQIKPALLLAAQAAGAAIDQSSTHTPRRGGGKEKELAELSDDDEEDVDGSPDLFTSPVGGGGVIGRWLQKLLGASRSGATGSPGADSGTHTARGRVRRRPNAVVSTTAVADGDTSVDAGAGGWRYPEWDRSRNAYRPDWCTVVEQLPLDAKRSRADALPDGHNLRRSLGRLGLGLERVHRRPGGDEVDIDAAVESWIEVLAGTQPDESVYVETLRRRRDLSVLVLLDVSGSTAEPSPSGGTVHHHQQGAAAALTSALHDLGDRVALYAFHSQGRSAVQVGAVKRYDDPWDSSAAERLAALTAGGYSRLGAAIRHATAVALREAGTPRRLLVVLSDGLAYDHGYERAYGAADARRALAEARRAGVGCLCLSIGSGTGSESLREVFGSAAYAAFPTLLHAERPMGGLLATAMKQGQARRRFAKVRTDAAGPANAAGPSPNESVRQRRTSR